MAPMRTVFAENFAEDELDMWIVELSSLAYSMTLPLLKADLYIRYHVNSGSMRSKIHGDRV